ncbi:MAG: hypothetical protein SNJ71_01490 [Bacteroidales bacterium]
MKNLLIFTIVVLLCTSKLFAQDTTNSHLKYTSISWSPLYLANYGLRFDLELPLKNPKNKFMVAPIFNQKTDNSNTLPFEEKDEFWGIGALVGMKHFFEGPVKENFLYLGYGCQYNYYEVTYNGVRYSQRDYYNLEVYSPEFGLHKIEMQRVTPHFIMGFQHKSEYRFILDIYVGAGAQYIFSSNFHNLPQKYRVITGFGYKGILPMLGAKIGVVIK